MFREKQLEVMIKEMLEDVFYNVRLSAIFIQFNEKKNKFYYSVGKKNKKDKSVYKFFYEELSFGLEKTYTKEQYEHASYYNYTLEHEIDPHKLSLAIIVLKQQILARLLLDHKRSEFKDTTLSKDIDKKVKQVKEFSKKILKKIIYTKPFEKEIYEFLVKYEDGKFISKKKKENKDLMQWHQIVYFVDQLEEDLKTKKQLTRDFQSKLIDRFFL